MIGFFVVAIMGQWKVTVLADSISGLQGPKEFFLHEGRWPIVITRERFYRYDAGEGIWMNKETPPENSPGGYDCRDYAVDGYGKLHITDAVRSGQGDSIYEYVEADTGWERFIYLEEDKVMLDMEYPFVSIAIGPDDTSHLVYEPYSFPASYGFYHLRRKGGIFLKDTFSDTYFTFSPDARVDSTGKLWVLYYQPGGAYCVHWDNGWQKELIELGPTSYWCSRSPYLALRGTAFALYKPTGLFKQDVDDTLRFAWRRPDGTWDREKMRGIRADGLGIDAGGLVHILTGLNSTHNTGYAYHVIRDTSMPFWETLEIVDSVNGLAGKSFMLVDVDGYLQTTYRGENGKLCYATTNPNVGVYESPPEPKPSLVLVPTNQGFWITGYSGEARIYDPAGRLVLSKEIKGKTLIGPMRPGVYFVVAGKERARVAVR